MQVFLENDNCSGNSVNKIIKIILVYHCCQNKTVKFLTNKTLLFNSLSLPVRMEYGAK